MEVIDIKPTPDDELLKSTDSRCRSDVPPKNLYRIPREHDRGAEGLKSLAPPKRHPAPQIIE
jgi:hypothetical protein